MSCTSLCCGNRTCLSRTTITADTSLCFAVGIRIPQHRVVLEVGFSRLCGQAFIQSVSFLSDNLPGEHNSENFNVVKC